MIEKIVRDYFDRVLSVPALMEEHQEMPKEYVIIEKTADSGKFIGHATFAIQSYADTRYEAACLSSNVVGALDGLLEDENICSVELDGEYDWTDTGRKKYRYQAVVSVCYYREG